MALRGPTGNHADPPISIWVNLGRFVRVRMVWVDIPKVELHMKRLLYSKMLDKERAEERAEQDAYNCQ